MGRLIKFCVLLLFSTLTESIPFPSSQPVYNNNIYPNEPIKQGPTVDVIHNKNQKQHPVINGGIDHKIQPLYKSVEPGPIKLNSVPEPYISPTTSTQRERAEIAHAAAQANDRAAVLTAKEAQLARAVTKPDFKQTNTYIPPKQYQYANLPSDYHQVRQLIQSNPKLKDVVSSVKSKKRYLVVYPDGRVEHVDNLEPIVQKHPDHVLINADTLRNHMSLMDPPTNPGGTSIPNPLPVQRPATANTAPAVATTAASTATTTTLTSAGPISKALLKPHNSSLTKTSHSEVMAPVTSGLTTPSTACTSTNYPVPSTIHGTPENLHTHATAATKSVIHPSHIPKPTPIPNTHVNTSTITSVNAGKLNNPLKSSISTSVPKSLPIPIPTKHNVAPAVATVAASTANAKATVVTSAGPLSKALLKPHISHEPAKSAAATSATAATVNKSSTSSTSTKTLTTSSSTATVAAVPTSSVIHPSPIPKPTPVSNTHANILTNTVLPIIPPKSATIAHSTSCTSASSSNAISKTHSSTSNVNSNSSASASKSVTSPQTVHKSSLQATSNAATGTTAKSLGEDSDDITNCELDDTQLVGEPVVWFEVTDLDFWDKLIGDEPYSVIYFINIPPQPIIERDTKTTVYSNGTIVEEITETKKDKNTGEPIVRKSVRCIEPK